MPVIWLPDKGWTQGGKSAAQGTSKLASYGDNFGKMGIYVKHPGTTIQWSRARDHAVDRMLERGVTKEMAEQWVRNGKALSQNDGKKHAFVSQDGVVVVTSDGQMITAWTKKDFNEEMIKIVQKLYGGN